MIVVSDTSPVSNFFRIGQLNLLHFVFGDIAIPFEVYDELKQLSDFGFNVNEIFSLPWLYVKEASLTLNFYNALENVHLGEAAAIALAKELHAAYLLIDDRKGHSVALQNNLQPIGTLGVFKIARDKNIISSVGEILDRIIAETSFWLSRKVYNEFLKICNEDQKG